MSKTPNAEPMRVQEFAVKQSKFDLRGEIPIRSVLLGPSGSGKTVLLKTGLYIFIVIASVVFLFSAHL